MIVLSQYSVVAKSRTQLYRRVISYWRQLANKGRPTTRTHAAWVITTLHIDCDVDVRSARTRRNTHEQRTKVVVMSVKVKWAHRSHLHGETSDDRDSEPPRLPPSLAISGLWQAGDSFPPRYTPVRNPFHLPLGFARGRFTDDVTASCHSATSDAPH